MFLWDCGAYGRVGSWARRSTRGVRVGELIVVAGPPGAGKSTVAERLADGISPSALVRGDDFFAFVRQGFVAPWLAGGARPEPGGGRRRGGSDRSPGPGGYTVVYDGVVGPWFVDEFARSCEAASLHYVVLLPPEHVALERVRTRPGHGFTDLDAARGMHRSFREARVDARHVVTEVGAPEATVAGIRQRLDAGQLRWP